MRWRLWAAHARQHQTEHLSEEDKAICRANLGAAVGAVFSKAEKTFVTGLTLTFIGTVSVLNSEAPNFLGTTFAKEDAIRLLAGVWYALGWATMLLFMSLLGPLRELE